MATHKRNISTFNRIVSSPMYAVGYLSGSIASVFGNKAKSADEYISVTDDPNMQDELRSLGKRIANLSYGIAAVPVVLGAGAALSPVMTTWAAVAAVKDITSGDKSLMPSVSEGYKEALEDRATKRIMRQKHDM